MTAFVINIDLIKILTMNFELLAIIPTRIVLRLHLLSMNFVFLLRKFPTDRTTFY